MVEKLHKIKKGDKVKVISGNDKGKEGKVISVLASTARIVIEGINIKKKHVRPRRQGQKGEIVRIPGSVAASRVMIICPKCSAATRVGYSISEGVKSRICKKCGSVIA